MTNSANPIDQNDRPPKRRRFLIRCLFGLAWLAVLVVLFYVEENWRGARALEIYNRQLAAKGGTLDLKAFIPPPVPDAENCAMTPFLVPLFDFIPGTQQWRDSNGFGATMNFAKSLPDISSEGGWRVGKRIDFVAEGKDVRKNRKGDAAKTDEGGKPDRTKSASAALATLAEYDSVIEELRTASRRPHARFNVRYDHDDPAGILLPHLSVIRRACQILSLRSSAELTLGQTEQAFNDVTLMLHLVGVLKGEPFLISHLVRQAELQMTMQKIWEGFAEHQWSDAQLQWLQERLQLFNLLEDLKRSFEAERAAANLSIDQARVSRNLGLSGLKLDDAHMSDDEWLEPARVVYKICPAGWYYQEQLNYNRMFDARSMTGFNSRVRRVSPKVCEENSAQLVAAHSNRRPLIREHRVFATLLLPAHSETIKQFALAQNSLDEAVIVCALERFRLSKGQYPQSLDALVPQFISKLPHDIINGEPLKYRRVGDGQFILYSVGWNEVDDGGATVRYEGSRNKAPDMMQGDWVWQFPAE